jgi:hypothetical protein
MAFLGAETAFPCVLGRRVGSSRPWPRPPKQAGSGEEIPGDILAGFYRPAAADLMIRTAKN